MTGLSRTAHLDLTFDGPVAVLRLSNPPLNLLTVDFFGDLRQGIDRIANAPQVRALVVSGYDGGPFSAGSDMAEFEDLSDGAVERKILVENLALADLEDLAIPTIAAVERYALGGGLELALACDLRVAGARARLALPEVTIGGLASNGAQRLTTLIGPARASQLLFLGDEVDGEEAERIGLVNWSVEAGSAFAFAVDVGRRIAAVARGSIERSKGLVRETSRGSAEWFLWSVRAQEDTFGSWELSEGVKAFFEKRTPDFNVEQERGKA